MKQLLIFSILMLLGASAFASDVDSLIQQAPQQLGGKGVYALRMGYLGMCLFGAFWGCFVAFNVAKWSFVERALSENGSPSGFRLMGYVITTGIVYAFTYNCVRKQMLPDNQLLYMILFALVLLGIVKFKEIVAFFKGQPSEPAPPQKPAEP